MRGLDISSGSLPVTGAPLIAAGHATYVKAVRASHEYPTLSTMKLSKECGTRFPDFPRDRNLKNLFR